MTPSTSASSPSSSLPDDGSSVGSPAHGPSPKQKPQRYELGPRGLLAQLLAVEVQPCRPLMLQVLHFLAPSDWFLLRQASWSMQQKLTTPNWSVMVQNLCSSLLSAIIDQARLFVAAAPCSPGPCTGASSSVQPLEPKLGDEAFLELSRSEPPAIYDTKAKDLVSGALSLHEHSKKDERRLTLKQIVRALLTRLGSKPEAMFLLFWGCAEIDVNVRQPGTQYTPLMFATEQRELEVAKFLLDHKADPYLQSAGGWNALRIARSVEKHPNRWLTFEQIQAAEIAEEKGLLEEEEEKCGEGKEAAESENEKKDSRLRSRERAMSSLLWMATSDPRVQRKVLLLESAEESDG